MLRKFAHWKWQLAQAAEWRWWRHYWKHKNKDSYYQWKRNYWNDLLEKYALQENVDKANRILDAGCGPAGIFTVLPLKKTTAIDPLLDRYENATFFRSTDFQGISFEKLRLEELNSHSTYDLIFCLNAINHVEDLSKSLRNLNDALSPEGLLVLSTDVHRYQILSKLFRLLPGDILHPQQYTHQDYLQILSTQNFHLLQEDVIQKSGIFDYRLYLLRKQS